MHLATVHLTKPFEGNTEAYFASLDGDHYLPVTRLPRTSGDVEALEVLFEGGNGFKPMTWAERAIRQLGKDEAGAVFSEKPTPTRYAGTDLHLTQ